MYQKISYQIFAYLLFMQAEICCMDIEFLGIAANAE